MTFKTFAIGALCAGLTASAATAATMHDVTITNVVGDWVSVTPTDAFDFNKTNGTGFSEIRWGDPFYSSRDPQSGYRFDATVPPPVSTVPGGEFVLGEFTHFNRPISMDVASGSYTITQATLRLDYDLNIGAESFSFTQFYTFNHDETANFPNWPNEGGDCPYGGSNGSGVNVNGCADSVTATLNEGRSESLKVDGFVYDFEISGFKDGENVLESFFTTEKSINKAILVGTYSVSQVPLPAAGWMLLAGIGGLAALKRRRRAASA